MKKLILSVLTIAVSGISYAQDRDFTITDLDMVAYENNSIQVFNVHGTFEDPIDEAKLHLVINNVGNEVITVTGQVVEMTNTDGSLAQFCIGGPSGNCFFPLNEGAYYPGQSGGTIQPGANWGMFDYLINLDPTNLAEYKLRFVQLDGGGNEIPGSSFFLTYLYDENAMAVSDVQSISIATVYPTVAKGFTNVTLKENASVKIVNLEGKNIRSFNLKSGNSKIDLSGLASGVYLISFKGDSGMTTTHRVIVK